MSFRDVIPLLLLKIHNPFSLSVKRTDDVKRDTVQVIKEKLTMGQLELEVLVLVLAMVNH